ncbi:MAG TPA: glycine cleavage system aminomethyltransferase GcvT [Methylomirabilota bacterium]|jgi:aminomethyltransferase|nr:glycine cleavage system aminomethyltransferase GcvT [Methylomirabilota bacterium]
MTQPETVLKRTPLHAAHVRLGARMIPFGGWDMPVQYSGIVEEHRAVRGAVGCFDVSHMGEFEFRGPDSLRLLQRITTNDVAALQVGQVHYSLLCYEDGGIIDDLTLYRLADDHYMMTVNASNIDKDWAWVSSHLGSRVDARNVSEETGLIAVQGPHAERLVGGLADVDVGAIGYYHFRRGQVAGVPGIISRTGYTGEDGFELYLPAARTEQVWERLLAAGKGDGAVPVGLGARDTLRLEMKYALYGNDIDETANPLEAGLGWVVKPAKGEFIGRTALEGVRAAGLRRRLVGFEMVERAVARHGYPILHGGSSVGIVTSGSYGPSVDRYIGIGYVPTALAAVDSAIAIEVRGRGQAARVVKTPFYPPRVKR